MAVSNEYVVIGSLGLACYARLLAPQEVEAPVGFVEWSSYRSFVRVRHDRHHKGPGVSWKKSSIVVAGRC